MATRDDKPMAGLLRRGLSRTEASARECPGPELLAAYYERSLDPAEKTRWEVHFASCAHCREQLAALARSEPPEALATRLAWVLNWRWLAPAAAALALALVWVIVRSSPILQNRRPAQSEQTAANALSKRTELAENATPAPSETPRKEEEHPLPAAAPEVPRVLASGTAARKAPRTAAQDVIRAKQEKSENEPSKTSTEAKPRNAPENSPVVAGNQMAAETAVRSRALAVPNAPAPPLSTAAPNEAMPPASAQQADRSVRPSRYAAAVRESASQAVGQGGVGLKTVESGPAQVLIPTPDVAVVWRITPEGEIERSTDAGKTWQVQWMKLSRVAAKSLVERSAAAGEAGPRLGRDQLLTAGAAPSTTVCWIVGRAGTILRTTDGAHWERVASPAAADLVAVHARDAQDASVTTADGRTFVTEDGAQTWQLKP